MLLCPCRQRAEGFEIKTISVFTEPPRSTRWVGATGSVKLVADPTHTETPGPVNEMLVSSFESADWRLDEANIFPPI